MAERVRPMPLKKIYGEQLSLSTTAARKAVWAAPGSQYQVVLLKSDVAFRLALAPAIVEVLLYDGSTYTSYAAQAVDRDDSTDVEVDGMTTSHKLYVLAHDQFGGLEVNMDASEVNSATATMTVKYYDGSSWTDISATDGTASGGATLAQDGNITWTTPSDWVKTSINNTVALYGVEITVSATLTNPTSINGLIAINEDANRGYFEAGKEYSFTADMRHVGALDALVASGTGTLDITWLRY